MTTIIYSVSGKNFNITCKSYGLAFELAREINGKVEKIHLKNKK